MNVVAFGDWHGNTLAAQHAISVAHEVYPDVKKFIHVGDFGFWDTHIFTESCLEKFKKAARNGSHKSVQVEKQDLQGYVSEVNNLLEELDITLYVCLGNHENYWSLDNTFGYYGIFTQLPSKYDSVKPTYDWETRKASLEPFKYSSITGHMYYTGVESWSIDEDAEFDEEGFITSKYFPRIKIIPRAHIWNWDGIQYASLGGANSIDVAMRTRGISWWEQESILPEETDALIQLCNDKDIDVLITHDGPIEVVRKLYGHGKKLPESIEEWGNRSGKEVQRAIDEIRPKVNICGHHHIRKTDIVGDTTVEILDRDGGHISANRIDIHSALKNAKYNM